MSKKGESCPPPLQLVFFIPPLICFSLPCLCDFTISFVQTYIYAHVFVLWEDKDETDMLLFLPHNGPIPSFSRHCLPPWNTITKYQALPSPFSCMLGELRCSAGLQNKGNTVSCCWRHCLSITPTRGCFQAEGKRFSRSDLRGKACSVCGGRYLWEEKKMASGKLTQRPNVRVEKGWYIQLSGKHTCGLPSFIHLT